MLIILLPLGNQLLTARWGVLMLYLILTVCGKSGLPVWQVPWRKLAMLSVGDRKRVLDAKAGRALEKSSPSSTLLAEAFEARRGELTWAGNSLRELVLGAGSNPSLLAPVPEQTFLHLGCKPAADWCETYYISSQAPESENGVGSELCEICNVGALMIVHNSKNKF